MPVPQTSLADIRRDEMRDLVTRLADELGRRTFSPRIKLLDMDSLCAATGLSESTIERLIRDEDASFPKPQNKVGKRLWRESAVIAWMDANDPNGKPDEKGRG